MKYTVTVGIPVYNEENNIVHLIKSILQQDDSTYILEKIVVISDNSTDKTNMLVRGLTVKYPQVSLIAHTDRKGKCQRLNDLFQSNTSEVLIVFDGDIGLSGKKVLEHIVSRFDDPEVSLVGVNDKPVPSLNIQNRVINAWFNVWARIRISYKNGVNLYNLHGNALVLRKSFAKTIQYPEGLTADQDYLYLSLVSQKKKFAFAHNAIIYFYTPETIKEFFFQTTRFLTEKKTLYDIFGNWIKKEYAIPQLHKYKKILESIVADPIFTSLALVMYLGLLLFTQREDPLQKTGMWKTVESTKKAIQL